MLRPGCELGSTHSLVGDEEGLAQVRVGRRRGRPMRDAAHTIAAGSAEVTAGARQGRRRAHEAGPEQLCVATRSHAARANTVRCSHDAVNHLDTAGRLG